MKTWTLTFWTPGHAPVDDGHIFGCASHGIATAGVWFDPEEAAAAGWSDNGLEGDALAGTYDAVLARLGRLAWKPAAAGVLFAQGAGVESFWSAEAARLVRKSD